MTEWSVSFSMTVGRDGYCGCSTTNPTPEGSVMQVIPTMKVPYHSGVVSACRRVLRCLARAGLLMFAGFCTGCASPVLATKAETAQIQPMAGYTFAHFRVDELGQRRFGDEISAITDTIGKASSDPGPLVVVFVHGWKHDAADTDTNVQKFHVLLKELSGSATVRTGAGQREVIGIYVSWPANDLSSFGPIQNLTFWNTRDRADRVWHGGEVSKLLDHLHVRVPEKKGFLLTIGHSFGARIVFGSIRSTIASAIVRDGNIAAAGDACEKGSVCKPIKGFGDLVVLLNPAFEAYQYQTFAQYGGGHWAKPDPASANYRNVEGWPRAQLPLILTVGAENDKDTSSLWSFAHLLGAPLLKTTLTNHQNYVTHSLRVTPKASGQNATAHPRPTPENLAAILDRTRALSDVGNATLEPVGAPSNSPFIVARADKDLIDGHGGIWEPPFLRFLVEYMGTWLEARRLRNGY